jgi:hypothetical protein
VSFHGEKLAPSRKLVDAEKRDAIDEWQMFQRIGRNARPGNTVHHGVPLEVAPYVARLDRLGGERKFVHGEHHRAHVVGTPAKRDASASGNIVDAHHRQIRVVLPIENQKSITPDISGHHARGRFERNGSGVGLKRPLMRAERPDAA